MAVTLLTLLPLTGPRTVDRRTAGRAMCWAPAVGLLVGLPTVLVVLALRKVQALTPVAGLLPGIGGVATLAFLTRGLHLDGFTDVLDGVGGGHTPQRRLEIMKDSRIGAFGATGLFLLLATDVVALATDIQVHHGSLSILLAAVTGRLAVTWVCATRTPAARPDGLGALVSGSVSRVAATGLTVVVLAGAVLEGLLDFDGGRARLALQAVLAVGCALGASDLLRRWAVRRLGGITGDVLGAVVEVSFCVVLVVMSLRLQR